MLDARLRAARDFITANCHVDIGSDHAKLPYALLKSGRVNKIIVVEKTAGPVRNAQRRLFGMNAEVRLGDGFEPISPADDVDSASLCGMGGDLIVRILQRFPDRLPRQLVLQPNSSWYSVRRWALDSGFRITGEQLIAGRMHYPVIQLERRAATEPSDPAYEELPLEPALEFGPRILREAKSDRSAPLHNYLETQLKRLEPMPTRETKSEQYLVLVRTALNWLG